MQLNFDEILDGAKFEDLVTLYFQCLADDQNSNRFKMEVKPSGVGADGGRDILITFKFYDEMVWFGLKNAG